MSETAGMKVDGANQCTTYADVRDTWRHRIKVKNIDAMLADVVTIDGVHALKQTQYGTEPLPFLQQFVVLGFGDGLLITPPIITGGPYRTVDAAPEDGAKVTVESRLGIATAIREGRFGPAAG